MTKLHLQIEEMRVRLTENARDEQCLVQALGDALSHVDKKLIDEVRNVTAEHEARRGAILNELQVLAARLCAFPAASQPLTEIGESTLELPPLMHANGHPHSPGAHAPGDWRKAARNIADELDFYLKGDGPNH